MPDPDLSGHTDLDLQNLVDSGIANPRLIGSAKIEIERRRRRYAEEREQDRRDFETEMFEAAGKRESARQEFEEKLAQRQMDHAAALAKEQLDTAEAAARAAKRAAWAAAAATVGAIAQAIIAAMR
jgi:hypothetical protein